MTKEQRVALLAVTGGRLSKDAIRLATPPGTRTPAAAKARKRIDDPTEISHIRPCATRLF